MKNIVFAMCNLGVCYANGTGVEKDMGKAEMWLRKAIKFGLEEAKPILQKVLEKKSNAGSQSK